MQEPFKIKRIDENMNDKISNIPQDITNEAFEARTVELEVSQKEATQSSLAREKNVIQQFISDIKPTISAVGSSALVYPLYFPLQTAAITLASGIVIYKIFSKKGDKPIAENKRKD